MTNTAKAEWVDGLRFVHTSGSGHALVTDAPSAAGGDDSAPSPMELLLHALAACTGVDVISILRKMKEPVSGLEVRVEAERAEKHPRIYTRVRLTYVVSGAVAEKKVARAVALSEKTYCSVSAMLGESTRIESVYEIKS